MRRYYPRVGARAQPSARFVCQRLVTSSTTDWTASLWRARFGAVDAHSCARATCRTACFAPVKGALSRKAVEQATAVRSGACSTIEGDAQRQIARKAITDRNTVPAVGVVDWFSGRTSLQLRVDDLERERGGPPGRAVGARAGSVSRGSIRVAVIGGR